MIWQKVVTGIGPHLKVEIIRAAVSVKERASTDDWELSLQLARRPRVATHQPARQPQEDSGKGLCGCNVDKPQRDILFAFICFSSSTRSPALVSPITSGALMASYG